LVRSRAKVLRARAWLHCGSGSFGCRDAGGLALVVPRLGFVWRPACRGFPQNAPRLGLGRPPSGRLARECCVVGFVWFRERTRGAVTFPPAPRLYHELTNAALLVPGLPCS
jgi:hypothetical protein